MIKENRSFWLLLLLTIPTLGIYNIVFWFKLTKDLNDMNPEEKKLTNYILVILFSILTLGIYHWVWFFYLCDRIQTTGAKYKLKVRPGAATQLMLKTFGTFVIIGPILATFLSIFNMNKVAKAYNANIKKKSTVVSA